jgi:phosphoglycerate dehydrogenase-like enzyme
LSPGAWEFAEWPNVPGHNRRVRILVASTAFPAAADLLGELLPEDEILIDHRHADPPVDVIVPLMSRVDAPMLDRFQPRLIHQFGVGLEGVDLDAAAERGIAVANVPAAGTGNADGVGEVAVMHLLVLARRLREAGAAMAARRLGEPIGMPLTGARVVIIGLGAVGQAVVARLGGFGARLIGVGSRSRSELSPGVAALELADYLPAADLLTALTDADALIVCAALNDGTRGLVGDAAGRIRRQRGSRPGPRLPGAARGAAQRADRRCRPRRVLGRADRPRGSAAGRERVPDAAHRRGHHVLVSADRRAGGRRDRAPPTVGASRDDAPQP